MGKVLIIASVMGLAFWPRALDDSAIADAHWTKLESQILDREIDALKAEIKEYREVLETAQTVINCESGGVHDRWGDKNRPYSAYGVAQFQKRTFDELAKKATLPDPDWKSSSQQVHLLIWALQN